MFVKLDKIKRKNLQFTTKPIVLCALCVPVGSCSQQIRLVSVCLALGGGICSAKTNT